MASGQQNYIVTLVEAKPFFSAVVGGVASTFAMGLSLPEAIDFGCVVAAGTSMGDALLTISGIGSDLTAYLPGQFSTYLDPNDFLGGALGVGIVSWMAGMSGQELMVATAVGAVSAGVAPKLSGQIISAATDKQSDQNQKTQN